MIMIEKVMMKKIVMKKIKHRNFVSNFSILGVSKFHFPRYKKYFQSGFFSII